MEWAAFLYHMVVSLKNVESCTIASSKQYIAVWQLFMVPNAASMPAALRVDMVLPIYPPDLSWYMYRSGFEAKVHASRPL